jgi:hypothetical protein
MGNRSEKSVSGSESGQNDSKTVTNTTEEQSFEDENDKTSNQSFSSNSDQNNDDLIESKLLSKNKTLKLAHK